MILDAVVVITALIVATFFVATLVVAAVVVSISSRIIIESMSSVVFVGTIGSTAASTTIVAGARAGGSTAAGSRQCAIRATVLLAVGVIAVTALEVLLSRALVAPEQQQCTGSAGAPHDNDRHWYVPVALLATRKTPSTAGNRAASAVGVGRVRELDTKHLAV